MRNLLILSARNVCAGGRLIETSRVASLENNDSSWKIHGRCSKEGKTRRKLFEEGKTIRRKERAVFGEGGGASQLTERTEGDTRCAYVGMVALWWRTGEVAKVVEASFRAGRPNVQGPCRSEEGWTSCMAARIVFSVFGVTVFGNRNSTCE